MSQSTINASIEAALKIVEKSRYGVFTKGGNEVYNFVMRVRARLREQLPSNRVSTKFNVEQAEAILKTCFN